MTQQPQLEKIAEGREAEIFAWAEGQVLKLYREGYSAAQPEHESTAMMAAQRAGAPVPASLGTTTLLGRPGLIMQRVDGVDMLTQLGKKPWTIFSAGTAMGRAHAALHAATAPDTLPVVKDVFPSLIRESDLIPSDLADFAVRALAQLPDGDRLCHGDFHPANLIVTANGPVVIDWPNASSADPHADVARTLLMIRVATLPDGSSAVLRSLDRVGRKILLSRYIAAYRRARPLDMALVERWMIPVAAHRLREQVPGERDKVLALLSAARDRGR